jgi:hypothetical protein
MKLPLPHPTLNNNLTITGLDEVFAAGNYHPNFMCD